MCCCLVEKGARAIRLSEAASIADVLGFSLADIENLRDPKDDFARYRGGSDAALEQTYDFAEKVAAVIWGMDELLNQHPDLLKPEEPRDAPDPTGITQYLEKIGAEWLERIFRLTAIGLAVKEPGLQDSVLSVMSNVVSTVVRTGGVCRLTRSGLTAPGALATVTLIADNTPATSRS